MSSAKCDKETGLCDRLRSRLTGYNCNGIGLSNVIVTHLKEGTETLVGVVHKTTTKDKGLMLNFCPWCGQAILWTQNDGM